MTNHQSTVFVVDDDPAICEAVTRLIASVGLRVEAFGWTRDYLLAKRPDGPACLVLDVRLPDVGGLGFRRELAQSGVPIPIIFITGHGDIPMTVRAMKAGAVEFLTKPFRHSGSARSRSHGAQRARTTGGTRRTLCHPHGPRGKKCCTW
jgi:FixJ family two-component response regulator